MAEKPNDEKEDVIKGVQNELKPDKKELCSPNKQNNISGNKNDVLVDDILSKIENISLNDGLNKSCKERNRPKIVIPEWLKDCEYPFNWHSKEIRETKPEQVINKTLQKIEELQVDNEQFTLQNFMLLLKLVLEYYLCGDMETANAMMKSAEDSFDEITKDSPDSECRKLQMPLGHTMSATKAHLFMLEGEEEKSYKIGKNIIPVKVMPDVDKAGLWAMKARYFLYSGYEYEGDIGVNCARKAVALDPGNPEWEYLLAKILRQKRRENPFSADIPTEELKLLEGAVERCKNTKYLVYLAQVYRECATQAFKHYRNEPGFYTSSLCQSINEMHDKALQLYKDALEVSGDCACTLRRVGYGVMNLPKKVADYKLALKCLLKSQEICYSDITLHMLGTFYLRYGNDNMKALECFEKLAKAETQAGLCDMVRVKYSMDPQYDPSKDLLWGLEWETKLKDRTLLKLQLAGYFLFIKRDFFKSLEYFNQVVDEDKDSMHFEKFKSFFLRMYEPIDLYKYFVNEALLIMQKQSAAESSVSDEEDANTSTNLGSVEDFLCKISEVHPELLEMTPDPNLILNLLQTSKEIEQKEKGFSRNENRNNFGSRHQRGSRPWQRGGSNFRGRGGERYSSENQRLIPEDNSDRRGRFSITNQRDNQSENQGGFSSAQRGNFNSSNEETGNSYQNYRGGRGRQNFQNRGRGNQDSGRYRNNRYSDASEGRENWRKK